jgi:hypothetical protein
MRLPTLLRARYASVVATAVVAFLGPTADDVIILAGVVHGVPCLRIFARGGGCRQMVPNWYPRPCTVVITDVPSFLRR